MTQVKNFESVVKYLTIRILRMLKQQYFQQLHIIHTNFLKHI